MTQFKDIPTRHLHSVLQQSKSTLELGTASEALRNGLEALTKAIDAELDRRQQIANAPDNVDALQRAIDSTKPKRLKKPKPKSRADRWRDACSKALVAFEDIRGALDNLDDAISELHELQQEYEQWKDNLDGRFEGSPLVEKLEAVCELSIEDIASNVREVIDENAATIEEAEGADLPLGFGRD